VIWTLELKQNVQNEGCHVSNLGVWYYIFYTIFCVVWRGAELFIHYAISRKVVGSIPEENVGFFNLLKPPSRTNDPAVY
jgi:hypothetical protein